MFCPELLYHKKNRTGGFYGDYLFTFGTIKHFIVPGTT